MSILQDLKVPKALSKNRNAGLIPLDANAGISNKMVFSAQCLVLCSPVIDSAIPLAIATIDSLPFYKLYESVQSLLAVKEIKEVFLKNVLLFYIKYITLYDNIPLVGKTKDKLYMKFLLITRNFAHGFLLFDRIMDFRVK